MDWWPASSGTSRGIQMSDDYEKDKPAEETRQRGPIGADTPYEPGPEEVQQREPLSAEPSAETPAAEESVETPAAESSAEASAAEEPPAEPEEEPYEVLGGEAPEPPAEIVVSETEVAPIPEAGHRPREIHIGTLMDALKCMVSFFTIIRIDVGEKEFNAMERNFWLAPALGFIVGFVTFLVTLIFGLLGTGVAVQAMLAIATVYVFSKFLHLDGLVDFGDGMIVSSGKQEDHIRALKDSLIGAGGFGVALVVVLLTVFTLAETSTYVRGVLDNGQVICVAFIVLALEVLVKNAQVCAAAFGKPGNGMAARQVGNTEVGDIVRSTALTVVLMIIAGLISWGVASLCTWHIDIPIATILLVGLVSVLLSVGVGYLMAMNANKTFGFVNGDILGATNEIARLAILLVCMVVFSVSAW